MLEQKKLAAIVLSKAAAAAENGAVVSEIVFENASGATFDTPKKTLTVGHIYKFYMLTGEVFDLKLLSNGTSIWLVYSNEIDGVASLGTLHITTTSLTTMSLVSLNGDLSTTNNFKVTKVIDMGAAL